MNIEVPLTDNFLLPILSSNKLDDIPCYDVHQGVQGYKHPFNDPFFLNIQVTVKAGSEPSFDTESDYLIILAGIYNS